jgi:hypothetical protein
MILHRTLLPKWGGPPGPRATPRSCFLWPHTGPSPLLLTALASSAATLLGVWSLGGAALPTTVKLDNAKVHVTEVTSGVRAVRERGVRAAGQVIVFLDDCRYQRIDPVTGEKTIRERKSGDVIWHDQGEDAPQLTNAGSKPYREIVIELK